MKQDPGRSSAHLMTVPLLLFALFLSGVAAIVNQTVWQRALKIYLAGSESASSMIIVLVFMLGLGVGSFCAGLWVHRIKNPLRALAALEIGLFAINLVITLLLALDISESVYVFQRLAVSLGVPLRVTYGVSATAVLFVPCFLMGITMPLVSEVSQRQLQIGTSRLLTVLFVLNTLGSVLGGLASGFLLMPYFGQQTSLLVGAGCNGAAALILFVLFVSKYSGAWPSSGEGLRLPGGRLAPEEILSFWFGFLALAYEMYLFRIAALAHKPLPYNFSLVLCYYLLFWSIGVFLANRIKESILQMLVISGALTALVTGFYLVDRRFLHTLLRDEFHIALPLMVSAIVYSLPCLTFGILFGQVLARRAKEWGKDVGRFYALNTFGSCLGILVMTLVGFEMNHAYAAFLIAVGYFALFLYARKALQLPAPSPSSARWMKLATGSLAACLAVLLPFYLILDFKPSLFVPWLIPRALTSYYGKDGVIEVHENGNMYWDGLWHSALSANGNHVGSSNWMLATIPILCHSEGEIADALVIGLGTGITAATLARCDDVKSVDVYEIDHKLLKVLKDHPEGALNVADDPKVHIIWQDGRAGLALNSKQYDLITQQPMYLKQAGSSILLSQQYMQLVKSRLKHDGIFCVYSNSEQNDEQALLVRKTVASVFPYCISFGNGYMILASSTPFAFRPQVRAEGTDQLSREIRQVGLDTLTSYEDVPRLEWDKCKYVITDNHPLVEYPGVVRWLLLCNR